MRTLTLSVDQEKPNSIKTISERGSSTLIYVIPRLFLKEFKNYPEALNPALYLLFGVDEDTKENLVYIGQTNHVYDRLVNHHINKEFWDVCIVTTGDFEGITQQLEHLASTKAKKANRYRMENSINPPPHLNSSELVNVANRIFSDIEYIISAIGYSVFEEVEKPKSGKEIFHWKTDHGDGRGILLNEKEFRVFKDSTARVRETGSFIDSSSAKLRKKLVVEGVLKKKDEHEYVLTKDYTFSSPSAAADVIAGRSCNGWAAWKTQQGITLDAAKRKKV